MNYCAYDNDLWTPGCTTAGDWSSASSVTNEVVRAERSRQDSEMTRRIFGAGTSQAPETAINRPLNMATPQPMYRQPPPLQVAPAAPEIDIQLFAILKDCLGEIRALKASVRALQDSAGTADFSTIGANANAGAGETIQLLKLTLAVGAGVIAVFVIMLVVLMCAVLVLAFRSQVSAASAPPLPPWYQFPMSSSAPADFRNSPPWQW